MKDISNKILEICMKISQGESPKNIIKSIKISEREKYQLNSKALEVLLLILFQFYNLVSMLETLGIEENE